MCDTLIVSIKDNLAAVKYSRGQKAAYARGKFKFVKKYSLRIRKL